MTAILSSLTMFGTVAGIFLFGIPVIGAILLISVKIIEGYERLKYGKK